MNNIYSLQTIKKKMTGKRVYIGLILLLLLVTMNSLLYAKPKVTNQPIEQNYAQDMVLSNESAPLSASHPASERLQLKEGDYSPVVEKLSELYETDEEFAELLDKAFAQAVTPPTGECSDSPITGEPFCWHDKRISDLLDFFESWLNFTPTPQNDGFGYYQLFYDLCYNNSYALQFVETEPGLGWTTEFTEARGVMMDSPVDPGIINLWQEYLGEKWDDYIIPADGYETFNQFFTREIKPSARPIIGDDTILSAPADSLINTINANLTADTQIRTKYDENLNIQELLAGSKYADAFNGGTAMSYVLLPTDYHHYHAPVSGTIIESKSIYGTSFGMHGEFYTYLNNDNIGGYKSKYGVFGIYHRGYYIIETEKYGLVAMIPIGLDDVNSINFEDGLEDIPQINEEMVIKKGDRMGHFAYGGSTVTLLFEPGVFSGIKVFQGQQTSVLTEKTE